MKTLLIWIKNSVKKFQELHQTSNNFAEVYRPSYRVASIEQSDTGEYTVVIQMIGKAVAYRISPEELLADDKMVDLFSPRDIRNLTYLGYLGINAPKYKILAQHFSDNCDKTIFALHKKGEKTPSIVSAHEISSNEEILKNLSQKDAHRVGFTAATEQVLMEKKLKDEVLRQLEGSSNNLPS